MTKIPQKTLLPSKLIKKDFKKFIFLLLPKLSRKPSCHIRFTRTVHFLIPYLGLAKQDKGCNISNLGVVNKWRHGLKRKGSVKDFVTSFMDEPLLMFDICKGMMSGSSELDGDVDINVRHPFDEGLLFGCKSSLCCCCCCGSCCCCCCCCCCWFPRRLDWTLTKARMRRAKRVRVVKRPRAIPTNKSAPISFFGGVSENKTKK